jgi:hypothetical protein
VDIRSKTLEAVLRDCSVALSSPATKIGGPPDLASIFFPSFFIFLDIPVWGSFFFFFGSFLGCLPDLIETGAMSFFPVALPLPVQIWREEVDNK